MTINDNDNKIINNDKISQQDINNIDNINHNELLSNDKNNLELNKNSENLNNNDIEIMPTIYYHLADETDDSSNESSSLFSSSCSSSTFCDSYSDSSTEEIYSDDSSYFSNDDFQILEIIKQALNKLKTKTLENCRNQNTDIEYLLKTKNKLLELDIQLKELSFEVKEIILSLNENIKK